jgi:4,5-dihydroxyphthalate decarboxylase
MQLKIGIGRYDRTQALLDGRVRVEGYEVQFESPPLEELFARAFDKGDYDIAELSFSNYLYLSSEAQSRYIGLPIFPSRMFRHSAFFIRADRGIRTPRDLAGRTIGVREYSMTAALVARGVIEDDYGVPASAIRWRCGPADRYDAKPIMRIQPRGVEMVPTGVGQNLSDMLRDGELDAMVAYKPPKCFVEKALNVVRLFPDHVKVEQDYFTRTRIFPIMHLVGIRRELASDARLCNAVSDAFERAKREAIDSLAMYQALKVSLPWAPSDLERVRAFMGDDYWPYGISLNRPAIEAIVRYSHAQGIATRILAVEELFAPAAMDWNPR